MTKTSKIIKEYFLIIAGTILLSIGVYFFKIPNGFATGGVSGIGTILGGIIKFIPVSVWIAGLNVFLLLVGILILGRANGIRTIFCSLLFSLLTYLLEVFFPMTEPFTNQPFLELIYAMLLTAFGSALIFNNNASSGGTDIVALILKKYTSINVGKALLIVDFIVAGMSFFVFGIEAGLFSLLGLFIKAYLVDEIMDSINSFKYFIAITDDPDMVTEYIIKDLHHGATVTEAKGSFTGNKKYMVHTVCKRFEAISLRKKIKSIDKSAFIIITTTSEIIGRGFRGV